MASKNVYFNIIAGDVDEEVKTIIAAKKENYTCKGHVKLITKKCWRKISNERTRNDKISSLTQLVVTFIVNNSKLCTI